MKFIEIKDDYIVSFEKYEMISLNEVFDILNRKDGLLRRSEEEMEQIINDEEKQFPELYCSIDISSPYKNKKLSHNGKKIFLIRVDFYNWCEEREITYMSN